jgi:hypothetical protein
VNKVDLKCVAFKAGGSHTRSSLTQNFHLNVNSSQQEADSISQFGQVEKTTRGRDSLVVRNLTLPFIKVTSLERSILAYHNKKLVVVPNLWTGSQ